MWYKRFVGSCSLCKCTVLETQSLGYKMVLQKLLIEFIHSFKSCKKQDIFHVKRINHQKSFLLVNDVVMMFLSPIRSGIFFLVRSSKRGQWLIQGDFCDIGEISASFSRELPLCKKCKKICLLLMSARFKQEILFSCKKFLHYTRSNNFSVTPPR